MLRRSGMKSGPGTGPAGPRTVPSDSCSFSIARVRLVHTRSELGGGGLLSVRLLEGHLRLPHLRRRVVHERLVHAVGDLPRLHLREDLLPLALGVRRLQEADLDARVPVLLLRRVFHFDQLVRGLVRQATSSEPAGAHPVLGIGFSPDLQLLLANLEDEEAGVVNLVPEAHLPKFFLDVEEDEGLAQHAVLPGVDLGDHLQRTLCLRGVGHRRGRREAERPLDPVRPGLPLPRRLALGHLAVREGVSPLPLVAGRLLQGDTQGLVVEGRALDVGVLGQLPPHGHHLPRGLLGDDLAHKLARAEPQPVVPQVDVHAVGRDIRVEELLQGHHARGELQRRLVEVQEDGDLIKVLVVVLHA
mmetsp:Transcript_41795/g.130102  ORF Transcript_41795/g.130102 Transcript_41795/m.130102 type:complete len:358 (+) Transcript_41795:113-1186(+)